ncbi:uncharacterized protein LOC113126012 isoform X2 [Mastacembelus armatus]|uniref:uncharacterized protein LOC113126012 isoform X2 n=1 Tax=Mastacembelus armatus TaxID=205130 RepID=UPI000E45CA50|nr:uncharacterized protein LOC113126012 isoform X2 [Mastacembelus armatus]
MCCLLHSCSTLNMIELFFLFLLLPVTHSVKHSLTYFTTASSGLQTFPEFVAVLIVDGVEAGYCDSDSKTAEPRQDWVEKLIKDDSQLLEWNVNTCMSVHQLSKALIEEINHHFNQTEDLPSVSLLQKTPSSPVSCHATGFYPDKADLFWRKDGEQLHEDVDHGEILPNKDGTFQMRVDLNLSSVRPEDWSRYDCVFQLSGVKNHIVTKLDKDQIRTNWETSSITTILIIISLVVLVLVLIAAVGFMVYREKQAPGNSSELSERLNPDVIIVRSKPVAE